jgi:RNA polymerase sigma factor (sigma-70 family)
LPRSITQCAVAPLLSVTQTRAACRRKRAELTMPQQTIEPASARDDRTQPRHARLAGATDEVLLSWARQGNAGAFTELYKRHYPDSLRYATRLTRQCSNREAPDDVVSEAMRKVLSALRRGHGPTIGFRQYLFTAVRSVTQTTPANSHDMPTTDAADLGAPAADEGLDAIVAMEAFESLPHRWRQVLWMTKVDELTPSEIAPLIGLTANSVAALAVRAREALRIAFVRAHLPRPAAHGCRAFLDQVARRAVVPITPTKSNALTSHLSTCDGCRLAAEAIEREIDDWSRLGDWDWEPGVAESGSAN